MRGFRTGLGVGSIALLLLLLGLFEVAQRWSVGAVPGALILLGGLALVAGYRAVDWQNPVPILANSRSHRILAASAGRTESLTLRGSILNNQSFSRLLDGLVAGAVTGGITAGFVLISHLARVEDVFVRAQPEVVHRLGFDLPPGYDALGIALVGVSLGLVGALLAPLRIGDALSWTARIPRVWSDRAERPLQAIGLVFLLALPPFIGPYWNQVLGSVGLYILLGLGLNVVVGFAGLLDLGYVAFYAIGAYTCAILTAPRFGVETTFWLAVPVAMAVAACAGALLGVPVLRMRGDYLAIVTLGFGEIIALFLNNLRDVTGGAQGVLQIPVPQLFGFSFDTPMYFYYLILAACGLVAFLSYRLSDSRIGRAWMAIREDEDVARAMGIDTVRTKLLAFAMGAAFAGLGGAIFAARQHAIFPADFTLLISIYVLCLIIIGGLGSVPGVIAGSLVLVGLPEVLRELADYRLVTFGALLVVIMLVRPEGMVPSRRRAAELRSDAHVRVAEA